MYLGLASSRHGKSHHRLDLHLAMLAWFASVEHHVVEQLSQRPLVVELRSPKLDLLLPGSLELRL